MQKKGRFELADHGTLFLDEIGDISLDLQPKLLRALQEQEFERLGSTKTIHVDVRIIAATHREPRFQENDVRIDRRLTAGTVVATHERHQLLHLVVSIQGRRRIAGLDEIDARRDRERLLETGSQPGLRHAQRL